MSGGRVASALGPMASETRLMRLANGSQTMVDRPPASSHNDAPSWVNVATFVSD